MHPSTSSRARRIKPGWLSARQPSSSGCKGNITPAASERLDDHSAQKLGRPTDARLGRQVGVLVLDTEYVVVAGPAQLVAVLSPEECVVTVAHGRKPPTDRALCVGPLSGENAVDRDRP